MAVGSATTTSVGGFTLDHAAPELLEGGKSSPASDVYALGTTVWELLAGRPPFREHRDVAMAAIMMRILTQPVPEPPEGTPAELAALLRSMTAKQPGERPADMTAVAAAAAGIRARSRRSTRSVRRRSRPCPPSPTPKSCWSGPTPCG